MCTLGTIVSYFPAMGCIAVGCLNQRVLLLRNNRTVVTSGSAYVDIDVLACVSAYTELAVSLGVPAISVLTAPWNQTIPKEMYSWPICIEKKLTERASRCAFVLVDISDPLRVEKFVCLDAVTEVFDHHHGYEAYWNQRLRKKARIESVGACATLIWEHFKRNGVHEKISPLNANLLYTAIFANTLDFKSNVTCERDIQAAQELHFYATLPNNWKSTYYESIGKGFENECVSCLLKDTKHLEWRNRCFCFGQIELWNAKGILPFFFKEFVLREQKKSWIVNIASIEEGRSFIFCDEISMQETLHQIVGGAIQDNVLIAPRLWLRKELIKELSLFE